MFLLISVPVYETLLGGGRSRSSQRRESLIYNDAIKELKTEARRVGGNGIVGLKIDFEKIGGGVDRCIWFSL